MIGGTAPGMQTCERSSAPMISMASRPRWAASTRSWVFWASGADASTSMKAAKSTTTPMVIAISSSMSVKPDSSRARVMSTPTHWLSSAR